MGEVIELHQSDVAGSVCDYLLSLDEGWRKAAEGQAQLPLCGSEPARDSASPANITVEVWPLPSSFRCRSYVYRHEPVL
jgi:hypothetical protein